MTIKQEKRTSTQPKD